MWGLNGMNHRSQIVPYSTGTGTVPRTAELLHDEYFIILLSSFLLFFPGPGETTVNSASCIMVGQRPTLLFLLILFQPRWCHGRLPGLRVFLSHVTAAVFSSSGSDGRNDLETGAGQEEQAPSSWLDGFELEDANDNHDSGSNSDHEGLDCLQLHPLLQIPCGLSLADGDQQKDLSTVTTVLDTGSQRTVMSWQAAKRAGFLLTHMDRRYAGGRATGVGGSCAVLGRIPEGICRLHLGGEVTVPSPAIYVLESTDSVDVLLGLDFLRDHQAVLNLHDEELKIRNQEGQLVTIPFIRPRGAIPSRQFRMDDACSGSDSEDDEFGDDELDMSGV
jgi:hypothetical protein